MFKISKILSTNLRDGINNEKSQDSKKKKEEEAEVRQDLILNDTEKAFVLLCFSIAIIRTLTRSNWE